MTLYFIQKGLESGWNQDLLKNMTFSLPSITNVKKYNFILIYNSSYKKFYIGKIYNTRKITTVDIALTVNEIYEIDLKVEDINDNKVEKSFSKQIINKNFIEFTKKDSETIQAIITKKNIKILGSNYFEFKNKVIHNSPIVYPQIIDSFYSALRIFGYGTKEFHSLTEDQIMSWDLKTIFNNKIAETPDGKYFFRKGDRNLYVHKVHSTKIEFCLGVDMIYNYYDEKRALFIQYKCLNHENEAYYKSKDRNSEKQLKKMKLITGISDCYNFKIKNSENLRICRCPVYLKLCSRYIAKNQIKPYGFYYPICIWSNFYYDLNRKKITLNDEPRISNSQFLELAQKRLIGTTIAQSDEINRILMKNTSNQNLKLFFTETNKSLNSNEFLNSFLE